MDYYYGEALRWSYGFDNPNKAAVLFACALPLAWMLWAMAWQLRRKAGRVFGLLLAAGGVLGVSFLLFMTYSRGGAVAGGVAVVYVILRGRRGAGEDRGWARPCLDVALMAALAGLFWATGLGLRAAEPLGETGDASVENRFVLWRSALQMAVDRPGGFGIGNAGEAYMNWYQPVEMSTGYRTMVNSYLTALVEWGWLPFVGVVVLAGFFWGWADPGTRGVMSGNVATGLRGALVAFAVAGVFSTTMEDPRLWILPGVCAGILGAWAMIKRRPLRPAILSAATALGLCLMLAAAGFFLREKDPERREFVATRSLEGSVSIARRDAWNGTWAMIADPAVLGVHYGKLVRTLAEESGSRVQMESVEGGAPRRLIAAGAASQQEKIWSTDLLVLLGPEIVSREKAAGILKGTPRVLLFVSEIDEDGRAKFWTEAAEGRENVETVVVNGVGRQFDWGWDQVIERLKREASF